MENYNPFSLAGKTILVTGASSGIGRATAIECSKLGARVILTARNEDRLKETLALMEGNAHQIIIGDITKRETIDAIVSQAVILDGLVLCAGRGGTLPFAFSTREKLDEVFDTNFFAPVELLRMMVKKKCLIKGSSVVFVSSIGGVFTHEFGLTRYGASKAAIHSVMKTAANELAARRIRVNSVNPGMTNTPLINPDAITQEQMEEDMKQYPMGRYGEPREIALGIVYLLSDASSWVTGQALVIDGGRTLK